MKAKDRFSSNAPATDQMSADSTASSGNSFELGSQRQQQNGAAAGWERSGSSLSVLRIGIGQIGSREECQRKLGEQRGMSTVDRWLASFFRLLGHWIADCRVPLALGLLLFSALASSSIPFTPQQDDLRSGYTPKGAPSRTELARYERFFRPAEERRKKREVLDLESQGRHLYQKNEGAGSEEPISLLVFVQARDNGSLLEEKRLEEAVQLMDRLANDFPLGGRPFAQFCSDFCQLNEPVRQFTNGFLIRQRHLLIPADAEEGGARVNLSFPFMSLLGRSIDLSPHFFGTQLGQDGQLASLRLILLHFKADWPPGVGKPEVIAWERRIVHFLHSQYQGLLRPLAFTMGFVADEVVRTGMTLFPFLSVGFATMCAFSIGTVLVSAFYFRQFSRHKIVMALVACCCPLLACSSALGLLFWLGFRFGTILCVSPFLVLAIGVDDAFLMLQSWQRICGENGQRMTIFRSTTKTQWPGAQNNGKSPLRQRIGQMLVDVGPSITITSATNVLAFCVGIFTPTPEIQLFCAGNAVAIFFDYLYQLFLFTPCLAIVGQWEMEANEKIKQKERNQKYKGKKRMMLEMFGDRFRAELRQGLGTFMLAYCRWIASGFTASMVFGLLVAYWLVAANYARKVVPNITPAKLFLADSVLNEVIGLKDAYIVPNYMPVSVFVEKAGPLGEPTQMDRVKSLVEEFEREPNNRGPAFTHFWLRDYEQYLGTELAEEEQQQQQLEEASADGKNGTSADGSEKEAAGTFGRARMAGFLGWPEYRHWNGFLRFGSDGQLGRFFFITAFHGPELVEWNSRARLLGRWRAIAEKYADLGAFVWVEEAQFLDQIETLVPATIQSSIATLLCMSLVCSLFMSNLFTVVVATLSIVSICLGAFGLLVAWGIDLDPISMATTIMSIGFSVDFPAHITYHYYRCGKGATTGRPLALSPEQRVRTALLAIGFPLLQCGLSTILFVLCLLFVDTYMSEVFVKTMTLVVSLGLLHGLFVVPTMLCALSNLNNWLERFFPSKSAKGQRKNSFSSRKLQRTGSSKLVVSVAGPA